LTKEKFDAWKYKEEIDFEKMCATAVRFDGMQIRLRLSRRCCRIRSLLERRIDLSGKLSEVREQTWANDYLDFSLATDGLLPSEKQVHHYSMWRIF